MIIKVAIVEDEKEAYQSLEEKLKRYSRERNTEFQISYFSDGIVFLNDRPDKYDIVFMDINMPRMNGLEVAKKMREVSSDSFLFFVTDLAQYAILGYEVDAIDYIVKPVIYEHLSFRLDKVLSILDKRIEEPKLSFKTEEGLIALMSSQILYIETMEHKLTFHTIRGEYHSFGTLNEMEKILPKEDFIRCNHCYLVNLKYVSEIGKNDVTVGKDRLAISRSKKKVFMDAFTEYLGRQN